MSPRLSILTAAILAYAAVVAAQGTSPAKPQRPDQEAATPFRVSVDVVAVDVQVIDKTGRPVPDLGPEKFTVTINGRRRRVVSAERIGSEMLGEGERMIAASGKSVRGRVIVLAVDCISFDATASRGVIQAISQFVRQLSPDDFVGLSAYPNGAKLDPTTDHAAVLRALDTVVGQKDLAEMSQFHLRPSEIIDITRELMRGGGPTVDAIVARECGNPVDPVCQSQVHSRSHQHGAVLRGPGQRQPGHVADHRAGDGRLPRAQDAHPRQRRHGRERHAGRTTRSRRDGHSSGQGSRPRQHDHLHPVHRVELHRTLLRPDARWRQEPGQLEPRQRRSWGDGSSSSRAPRAARCSPSRSATPSRRSRASRPSCPRTTCSASSPATRTAMAARTRSR